MLSDKNHLLMRNVTLYSYNPSPHFYFSSENIIRAEKNLLIEDAVPIGQNTIEIKLFTQ